MDVTVTAVLSQLDRIFTSKDEQGTALNAFLIGDDVFRLLLTGFGSSLTENCSTSPRLISPSAPTGSLELLPTRVKNWLFFIWETFGTVCELYSMACQSECGGGGAHLLYSLRTLRTYCLHLF